MGRSIGGVLRGFAQLESQQREMKSYSKPMVTTIQWMGWSWSGEGKAWAEEASTRGGHPYSCHLQWCISGHSHSSGRWGSCCMTSNLSKPIKSSMYHSRRSRLPTLPMSKDDIRIEGRWQKTLSGEQFFLRKEGEVLIFATYTNMCLLAEATTIYVDGMFEICPRLFYQVFTINAFIHQLLDTVLLLLIFD